MMEMAVVKWLKAAGINDVLVGSTSALDKPAPILALEDGYERGCRTRNAERGVFSVSVLCVRRNPTEAGRIALACEAAVRKAEWKATDASQGWTLCGVDTTVPTFNGYDGSGRAVFTFKVSLTCERDDTNG